MIKYPGFLVKAAGARPTLETLAPTLGRLAVRTRRNTATRGVLIPHRVRATRSTRHLVTTSTSGAVA